MGDFILVYMVDPAKVGDRFTMWPLHMTLVPWFEAPDIKAITSKLGEKVKSIKPLEVAVGDRAMFGGHNGRPVVLINNTIELQALHEKLLELVIENNWKLQGRYTGVHYKPHVTQKAGRDASGVLKIDAIYIAEKQSQGYRELVGRVAL